ncbi:MAG TPA: hypothetical protein DEA96_07545 [Leptospiraceae bacterium]|nr:hypothetical protein [Spirochaetaceae bacterium]HBS04799.1 hypothetical protein [Leptospiraceae bacterium]
MWPTVRCFASNEKNPGPLHFDGKARQGCLICTCMDEAQLYAMMRPRNVCICRGVSEKKIRETISSGQASNFDELQQQTRCCTGCGTCESKVRKIMNDELEQLTMRKQQSG